MGVILRRTAAGFYPYWIGRWEEDGKRHETTLVRWRGTPPEKGEKEGDTEFERSRQDAENLFTRIREKGRGEEEEKALVQKIHAARYGSKVERVKIADLAARWDALPHKKDLSEERRERVHSVIGRFVKFMGEKFPSVKEAGALTAEHFKAFFDSIDKSGVSARTWNDHLDILRGLLRKVEGQGKGFREYLANLEKQSEETVHRRPFTGEELEAIFAAAGEVDPELRPVLVAAACTALRRGDVARLRWDAVDLADGFVTVKTTKTGEDVEIPIFPPFRAVLQEAARKRRQGVPYVFPKIALAYKGGPDALDRRLRKVLAAAGFVRPEKVDAAKYPAPPSPADAAAMVEAGMRAAKWTAKRKEKGLAILERHLNGEDGRTIAREMGIARGAVSTYLHDMEELGEVALVSPPKLDNPRRATLAAKGEAQRKHRGSLCGWHSFRTTFCSLALANGVSMETLRRVTGHRTAEIVEKYYNQAKRAQARREFAAAMPKAIAGTVAGTENALQAAGPSSGAVAEEFEAVPADVAKIARMLAAADPATLAKVKKILQKGGGK